jgi:hypothetical protein
MSRSTAPVWPIRAEAAAGAGSPAETSKAVRGEGYPGKSGFEVSATAVRPSVVAKPNGIAIHAVPPKEKALTAVEGCEAIARCQYDSEKPDDIRRGEQRNRSYRGIRQSRSRSNSRSIESVSEGQDRGKSVILLGHR